MPSYSVHSEIQLKTRKMLSNRHNMMDTYKTLTLLKTIVRHRRFHIRMDIIIDASPHAHKNDPIHQQMFNS